MDSSEQLVARYLTGLNTGGVTYEPDGNVPPDFLIGGRIAVEVRRLNQHFEQDGKAEGLETGHAALIRFFERILPTFGPPDEGRGWWVSFDFRRPVDWKAIKRQIRAALLEFRQSPAPEGLKRRLGPRFTLEAMRAGIPTKHLYMLGAIMDFDQGGWVASEVVRNLNLCIAEKSVKVAPHRHRYPEWWLVLPDMIGPDLGSDERETIRDSVDLLGWDKVVLLHPRNPTRAFVLEGEAPAQTVASAKLGGMV